MSLLEMGLSTGEASISDLLAGRAVRIPEVRSSLGEIAELVSVGGWPGQLGASRAHAVDVLRGYVDDAARIYFVRVDGVRREPRRVERVIRSIARNCATQASADRIAADVGGEDGPIKY
jgi:hypothetical protein